MSEWTCKCGHSLGDDKSPPDRCPQVGVDCECELCISLTCTRSSVENAWDEYIDSRRGLIKAQFAAIVRGKLPCYICGAKYEACSMYCFAYQGEATARTTMSKIEDLRHAASNAEDTLKRLEYIDTETHGFRCADCGHSSSSHHDTCELAANLKELAKVT